MDKYMGIYPDKIHTTVRDIVQEMASLALNGDIMVQKGVFFTIREWSYFGLLSYYILSKYKVLQG